MMCSLMLNEGRGANDECELSSEMCSLMLNEERGVNVECGLPVTQFVYGWGVPRRDNSTHEVQVRTKFTRSV